MTWRAKIRARAPVRFCDLGGWTDTRIVPEGSVLNFAASLYTYVTLEYRPGTGAIILQSLDSGQESRLNDIRKVEYDGILDLFKAAVATSGLTVPRPDSHLYGTVPGKDAVLSVRSDAPAASGLGSSAALGVAAVAALAFAQGRRMLPYDVAHQAQRLETEVLGLECGVQDQQTSAHGGINYIDVNYPHARIHRLALDESVLYELEHRLIIVFTGSSHFSSAIHHKVIEEYNRGNNRHVFTELARCAIHARDALLDSDLRRFGALMDNNWVAQKALHPDITTPELEALCACTRENGAIGFKANGAGAGGTATILARAGREHHIREAVQKELGMAVLAANIDFTGLRVWKVPPEDHEFATSDERR